MKYRIKVFTGSYTGETRYQVQYRPWWWPFWFSVGAVDTETQARLVIVQLQKTSSKYIYVS